MEENGVGRRNPLVTIYPNWGQFSRDDRLYWSVDFILNHTFPSIYFSKLRPGRNGMYPTQEPYLNDGFVCKGCPGREKKKAHIWVMCYLETVNSVRNLSTPSPFQSNSNPYCRHPLSLYTERRTPLIQPHTPYKKIKFIFCLPFLPR